MNPQPAILITDTQTAGGQMTVQLFNSLITRTPRAVSIDRSGASSSSSLTFGAGYNDYHDVLHSSQLNGGSLGPGNLFVDPHYVDEYRGNLRLSPGSPVIDAGLACSRAGIADPDADGNHRLAAKNVDMGAYEFNGKPPTGVVLVGTPKRDTLTGTRGADVICGMGSDDTLGGKGGPDFIDGGTGNDTLTGAGGTDRLFGGSGDDTLCGHDGERGNDLAGWRDRHRLIRRGQGGHPHRGGAEDHLLDPSRVLSDGDDQVDRHRVVVRQLGGAVRRARVASDLRAEDVEQQLVSNRRRHRRCA